MTICKLKSLLCITPAILTGCASPYNLSDPTGGLRVQSVLKSLKCEMVTFLDANRAQRVVFGKSYKTGDPDAYDYRHIDIADDLYAGIYVTLREIDAGSLTVAANNRVPLAPMKSITYLLGPSIASINTFESVQNFTVAQSAKLDLANIPRPGQGTFDPNFACYQPIGLQPKSTKDVDYEALSAGQLNTHYQPQFNRVEIAGTTLSDWLRKITSEMSANFLAQIDNLEVLAPGQLSYSFTLDYKLTMDGRYSLIATAWNPLAVGGSASIQQQSTFQFIFNTNYAVVSLLAKQGNVGSKGAPCAQTLALLNRCKVDTPVATNVAPKTKNVESAISPRRSGAKADRRTPFDQKNNPNLFFIAPLGLPPGP